MTTTAPSSPWDRFFFSPTSVAPMTLLRVGWGAVTAAWAISLLPDIDPFFTEGDLLYERTLRDGAWNLLPRIGWEHAPMAACVLLLVASLATMVGWRTRLSAAVAVLCLLSLQRANTTIFNSGDLLLRQIGIAVVLAPGAAAVVLRRRPGPPQGTSPSGGPRPVGHAPAAARAGRGVLPVGVVEGAGRRPGTTAPPSPCRCASRTSSASWHPSGSSTRAVLLNLFTWATLAFEATFIALVWPRRTRLWVLAAGFLFHLGIEVFLDIGFFSIAIYLAYLAFLPEDLAERIVGRVDPHARTAGAAPDDAEPEEPTEDEAPAVV